MPGLNLQESDHLGHIQISDVAYFVIFIQHLMQQKMEQFFGREGGDVESLEMEIQPTSALTLVALPYTCPPHSAKEPCAGCCSRMSLTSLYPRL